MATTFSNTSNFSPLEDRDRIRRGPTVQLKGLEKDKTLRTPLQTHRFFAVNFSPWYALRPSHFFADLFDLGNARYKHTNIVSISIVVALVPCSVRLRVTGFTLNFSSKGFLRKDVQRGQSVQPWRLDWDKVKIFDLTPLTSTILPRGEQRRQIELRNFSLNPATDKTACKKRWSTLSNADLHSSVQHYRRFFLQTEQKSFLLHIIGYGFCPLKLLVELDRNFCRCIPNNRRAPLVFIFGVFFVTFYFWGCLLFFIFVWLAPLFRRQVKGLCDSAVTPANHKEGKQQKIFYCVECIISFQFKVNILVQFGVVSDVESR